MIRTLRTALVILLGSVAPPLALADRATGFDAPTTLAEDNYYLAQRQGRFLMVSLKTPHQVLSTSVVNGGQSKSIKYLVNYQSMEPRGDQLRYMQQITMNRQEYHQSIAAQLAIPSEAMASMGTAANMHQLAQVKKRFGDLSVQVFVTAGVKGNAQRAGDPTSWYQDSSGSTVVNMPTEEANNHSPLKTDNQGTINIMLLINQPLVAGAQTKIAILATEAKSAALAELAVSSRVSPFLATGTGTDQLIVASPMGPDSASLPSASGHLKLGELVGTAVREAVLHALRWQNGLALSSPGNILEALGRFGLTEETLLKGLQQHLLAADFKLAEQNLNSITYDSRASAAAFAYAALLDRLQFGNLPISIAPEALLDQATQVAVALSAKPQRWADVRQQLSAVKTGQLKNHNEQLDLFIAGLAQGWQAKWAD